jgi:hypothetical protein
MAIQNVLPLSECPPRKGDLIQINKNSYLGGFKWTQGIFIYISHTSSDLDYFSAYSCRSNATRFFLMEHLDNFEVISSPD